MRRTVRDAEIEVAGLRQDLKEAIDFIIMRTPDGLWLPLWDHRQAATSEELAKWNRNVVQTVIEAAQPTGILVRENTRRMSALPLEADIPTSVQHVCFVPDADVHCELEKVPASALFPYLVEDARRYRNLVAGKNRP